MNISMKLKNMYLEHLIMNIQMFVVIKWWRKTHGLARGIKATFLFLDKSIDLIYNLCIIKTSRKEFLQMARPKSDNVQINISIPNKWKTELENLARIYSVEEGKTITFLDLMRRGIKEKYQLGESSHV
jgi:hypothetical protein